MSSPHGLARARNALRHAQIIEAAAGSPGQFYNPATLILKIDERSPISWSHKESVKIDDLDVNEDHLVVLTSDGKNVQSHGLRFSDHKTTDLCIGFDGYQGVQRHEKNSTLCKCQWKLCKDLINRQTGKVQASVLSRKKIE